MATTSETHMPKATSDETPWREHPLEALIAVNQNLMVGENGDASLRAVNFMSYELGTICQEKNDIECLETLNDFFFRAKRFRVSSSPVLVQEILEKRTGAGIALAILYMHLGQQLGLQVHLVHWPLHAILKWECDRRCQFIDLEQQGKILSEDELLSMINKHKEQVRTLTFHQALMQYLAYLSTHLRQHDDLENLHKTLTLILRLEPENTRYLAERAILRRDLGLAKESLMDFKRYFAFTDVSAAAPEIVAVYESVRLLNI